MLEVELKLAVEGSFAPTTPMERGDGASRAGIAGIEELAPLDLRATYYDTPDLRLARNGITLRYRTGEGDRPGWTLKLPTDPRQATDPAGGRDELHFDGNGRSVPPEAARLVTAFARSATLSPVARLRTRRRRWSLRGGEGEELAELVDDRVSVLQRGRVVERFREVEIEGRNLDRPGLERIASVLAEDGGATVVSIPKLVRALGDRADAPPEVTVPRKLSRSEPAGEAVRAAIARAVERIVMNDPHTRLGGVEPLHQMRVGTRRLRSDLRTFRDLVDRSWADGLREELRWLGGVLGSVRDLDVLVHRLEEAAERLEPKPEGDRLRPLFDELRSRREKARSELLAALQSSRYVDLLERLVEGARSPALTPAAEAPSNEALPPLVERAWRKLSKAATGLGPDSDDSSFHKVRVKAKRARYAAEAVGPALGRNRGRQARRFARRAAAVQDQLGELQDSAVARDAILEIARANPQDGPFNLGGGRLAERQAQAREKAREGFPGVWKLLDRKKRLQWLRT